MDDRSEKRCARSRLTTAMVGAALVILAFDWVDSFAASALLCFLGLLIAGAGFLGQATRMFPFPKLGKAADSTIFFLVDAADSLDAICQRRD